MMALPNIKDGNNKADCATSTRQDNLCITCNVCCVLMEVLDSDECFSTNGC